MSHSPNNHCPDFDMEAVAWAYGKLMAFGVHQGNNELSIEMMDRLNLMLLQSGSAATEERS